MDVVDDLKNKALEAGNNIIETKLPQEYRGAAKIGL